MLARRCQHRPGSRHRTRAPPLDGDAAWAPLSRGHRLGPARRRAPQVPGSAPAVAPSGPRWGGPARRKAMARALPHSIESFECTTDEDWSPLLRVCPPNASAFSRRAHVHCIPTARPREAKLPADRRARPSNAQDRGRLQRVVGRCVTSRLSRLRAGESSAIAGALRRGANEGADRVQPPPRAH